MTAPMTETIATRPGIRTTQILGVVVAAVAILAAAITFGALAAGYRPVVIQTGSMGDTAPAGSLIIAQPRPAEQVAVGDVVIMRPDQGAIISHRVVDIDDRGDRRLATTKGDANESVDVTAYPLQGRVLVGRWFIPGAGTWLWQLGQPSLVLALVGLALLIPAVRLLHQIWHPTPRSPRRNRPAAAASPRVAAAVVVVFLVAVGVSWALLAAQRPVGANAFSARACFSPRLDAVQNGTTVHNVNGTVAVPINPVDPGRSFVVSSVRSNTNEPTDATVMVRLAPSGEHLELTRGGAAVTPPVITVEWSVVTYQCGLTVTHGVITGDGTNERSITLPEAPPAQRFALVSTTRTTSGGDFGQSDLVAAEIASSTMMRLRAQAPMSADRQLAWQVVTFDHADTIEVHHLSAGLDATETETTVNLPPGIDVATTFLLTGVNSPGSGPDLGARTIRAHLSTPTTVAISRQVGGEALTIFLQVVTLGDGTRVHHGTVDLAVDEPTATVAIPRVDPNRSSALATVAVPGPSAGGSSTMTADDIVGEATATFSLPTGDTVLITRDAVSSAASFGWQVIEWTGPSWWDDNYWFRQRIDVSATTAAPGGYTIPVVIDHAALVAQSLSRADGDDVRVLRWDAVGGLWVELDRLLDESSAWNAATTRVLFRTTDAIDAGADDTYWLYFGNSTPPPAPQDPHRVFALVEDFESGTLGQFEDGGAGQGWYRADPWTYRRPLQIGPALSGADLIDFPVMIQLTDATLAATAKPDGADLRFVDGAAGQILTHELEHYDPATGAVTAWVRIPVLSASGPTTVWLYAGAANAPDGQDTRQVWTEGFDAVWHLGRDPGGPAPHAVDSGRRSAGGIALGSMTAADRVPGVAGMALRFNGIDQLVETPPVPIGASGSFTVSAWLRPEGTSPEGSVLSDQSGLDAPLHLRLEPLSPTTSRLWAEVEIGGTVVSAHGTALDHDVWSHVAVTYDGSHLLVLTNGVPAGAVAASGLPRPMSAPLRLGHGPAGGFEGRIDEVQIHQSALSPGQLATHLANLTQPDFVVAGASETSVEGWLSMGTWERRKPVNVPHRATEPGVGDQAVFVAFTDTAIAATARPDGADLIFTAADGITRLDHVIESFDPLTGTVQAWVHIPNLASDADTLLYVYYDNPTARPQQDPVAVFGPHADLVILPR